MPTISWCLAWGCGGISIRTRTPLILIVKPGWQKSGLQKFPSRERWRSLAAGNLAILEPSSPSCLACSPCWKSWDKHSLTKLVEDSVLLRSLKGETKYSIQSYLTTNFLFIPSHESRKNRIYTLPCCTHIQIPLLSHACTPPAVITGLTGTYSRKKVNCFIYFFDTEKGKLSMATRCLLRH